MYLHFNYFLFILGILTYKWQVDFNNDQINVEVTFKKTADKNQNSHLTTSGNVDRPIDSMRYYLYDISFIIIFHRINSREIEKYFKEFMSFFFINLNPNKVSFNNFTN